MSNDHDLSQIKNKVQPKNWLVESILVTLFCCLPFGIVGIVHSSKVDTEWINGNENAALIASKQAGKWTKWGFFIGIPLNIILLLLSVVSGILGSVY